MLTSSVKTFCLLACAFLLCPPSYAHNGSVASAYPLANITVDGNFSDWPVNLAKYPVSVMLSDERPKNNADFSGFFQVGYNLGNRSMYVAFTITDDSFIEDTSANVRFNTQDCLELSIDARHLPVGSGVASFMYSKKLRNINNAYYDAFAKTATWKIMEVAHVQKGNVRYYEWRIMLGDQFALGKSVGFDFQVFDKDADGSFTIAAWGKGGFKFRNPTSLGDVLFVPANQQLATISGNVSWDRKMTAHLPGQVTLISDKDVKLWVSAAVDSVGHYSVQLPAGTYRAALQGDYVITDEAVYSTKAVKPVTIVAKPGNCVVAPKMTITGNAAPDLLPERGVLFDFNAATAGKVDRFIETYQRYFRIPGVSLALIKDGKVVYHKTYGVKNTFTGEKVDSNTLFEAASITKPVFSFAVQRLAERGTIDLDKPLYLYLPYPDIVYDERYKLMTARHVLTHRTGFPNWRSMNEDGKLDLKFTPGTSYNYSGEGFEYLKMVIEKITGKQVEQVLKEEVLDPIGLYHTFFSRNDSLRQMVANGHYDLLPTYDELPESPGMAWSMHTEANIFSKFMLYMLEQKGLNAATYQTMLSKHSEYNFGPDEEKPKVPTYMGMSLEIRETPFGKTFGHGGNNGDFKCQFEVYKDLKMGYAIFTNSNTSDGLLSSFRKFLVEGKDK